MDKELLAILTDISKELKETNEGISQLNSKMDTFLGNSSLETIVEDISSIKESLDNLKGDGVYNLQDVYNAIDNLPNVINNDDSWTIDLSEISSKLEDVTDAIKDLKGIGTYDSLADICDKLENVENAITSLSTDISMIGI